MFDIELCPLPFSMEEMFGFINCRFSGYPASAQEQALLWLHVSTRVTQKSPLSDETVTIDEAEMFVYLIELFMK